ncbi:hypothetical protein ACFLTH_04290 [Bacteroidota bacterium]
MFMGKNVRILIKGKAKDAYNQLKNKTDKESLILLKSINRTIDKLKENPQIGEPIKKDQIPREFKKTGIKNLYKTRLSNYWRMLYTIEGTRVEIFLFILSISSHKEYDDLFSN